MIEGIKIFLLLWLVCIGIIYALMRNGVPFLLPGDYLIIKASRRIYIPLGTSLVFTVVLFVLLKFFGF
jgi:hypothetical protein